jgi:glyoxylase I family protein
LHHIALRASDFENSLRFYTEGLGFTFAYSWGEGDKRIALLDAGDGNYLELFAGGQKAEAVNQQAAGTMIHFAVRVPDVDAAYQRALQAGAQPHIEPKDVTLQGRTAQAAHPVAVRIAFCKGPDGEIFEFFQNEEL